MISRRNFAWQIFSHVVLFHAILVLIALLSTGLGARYFFQRAYLAQSERQLHDTLMAIAPGVTTSREWCAAHSRDLQIQFALYDLSGKTICDSQMDLDSPKVNAEVGTGAFVLHGSISLGELRKALKVFDWSMGVVLLVLTATSLVFLIWEGRRVVQPISRILRKTRSVLATESENVDWDSEVSESTYGEWNELETSIEGIRKQLGEKIDALTQERQEQATLMSAISDAIIAVDVEGKPLFFNTNFELQFFSTSHAPDFQLWEVVREPEVLSAFRKALAGDGGSAVGAVPFDRGTGKRYFSVAVAPLRKAAGEVYGAVGIFHDVTDLKAAEQIRIDFVANVSHELRTPLTAIKGYTDTVREDVQKGIVPETAHIEAVHRNAERLMALINDLLDLSALESTDTLHATAVDTAEITSRIYEQVHGILDERNQTLETDFRADHVYADPRRLEQVLTNLIDNARKYSPSGSKIRVSWSRDDQRGTILRVSDNGPGIPFEHQKRLFERFYRIDRARSREIGGTGLGLAIVKHIMQRHGGNVWVESTPGTGSTFICRFPAAT